MKGGPTHPEPTHEGWPLTAVPYPQAGGRSTAAPLPKQWHARPLSLRSLRVQRQLECQRLQRLATTELVTRRPVAAVAKKAWASRRGGHRGPPSDRILTIGSPSGRTLKQAKDRHQAGSFIRQSIELINDRIYNQRAHTSPR